jgi:hypothetical protein
VTVTGPSDEEAERFAAALEAGGDPDPDLADDLRIAAMLAASGAALDPEPEARERARRRLLAALGEERPDDPGRHRAS